MKRFVLAIVLSVFLIAGLYLSCNSNEPIDDIYTQNIYSGAGGHDIGKRIHPYSVGYFRNIVTDHIELGNSDLLIPAYGEIYASGLIRRNLVVADTFYLITGATVSQELKGFLSNNLARLQYTDTTPNRIALITAAISFTANNTGTFTFQMYKSGVADLASKASDMVTTSDSVDNIAMVSLLTLQPGDYMEIYVSCNVSNTQIGFLTMSFTATTVD